MVIIRLLTRMTIRLEFWSLQGFRCWTPLIFSISTSNVNRGNQFPDVKMGMSTFQGWFYRNHLAEWQILFPRTVVKSDKDRKCDFISDCDDNSDEENCDISCPVHFNVSVSQQESSHISGTYTQTNDTINNRPVWRREGRQQWLYYSSERLKWLFATIQDGSSSILHSFEGDVICPHLSAGWIFLDKNKRQYSWGSQPSIL